jgi:hypothetical protein
MKYATRSNSTFYAPAGQGGMLTIFGYRLNPDSLSRLLGPSNFSPRSGARVIYYTASQAALSSARRVSQLTPSRPVPIRENIISLQGQPQLTTFTDAKG